ncbi:SNARE protein, putative [Plasmodium ovale]|uniref:SNARE protein, putative n=2 Tax=Plasmodium ovale TaxID=36330 RepID=A0A1A8WCL1_PLAOA|nr:SNARE protein, putative [Plasmodium ovale curtisi]SBS90605.1 SNARE protein, putative [Plasmodium ovale curtisi]SCP04441.1 SNARE protein, putative [Plasmodium ovale]
MNTKYEPVLDGEGANTTPSGRRECMRSDECEIIQNEESGLNNIYGKIVKIRKELEKSYNLFYSYNLIVTNDNDRDGKNSYGSYTNVYRNYDTHNVYMNTRNNLTLNKINALTNSFYMNVETLKNTYMFLSNNNINNATLNSETVIWERRIETLSNEANSYIKTLDNIYRDNLRQSQRYNGNNNNNTKKKRGNDNNSTISYLHNEKEILKEVENNLNIFHVQGMNTLHMLRKQNKFLKGVRKKVIDMYNYLGLSSSLIDNIKKTHKQNLIIVIAGIILSLLFFYVLYTYWKR